MSYASLIIYFRHSFSPQALLQVAYKKPILSRYKHTSHVKVNIADVDLSKIPLDRIRNFSIVAHIDHGKSTLADRMLEFVGAIDPTKSEARVLDKLKVEKERGITVKAQTASVIYSDPIRGEDYLLNLIDTPGHVDFSSEVSRSLSACQGVILLIDANQGVQAQTVSNFYLAFSNDLKIVPVVNKIDLPNANPEAVKDQLFNLFEIYPDDVIEASAKTGYGVEDIFEAVVDKIPPPNKHNSLSSLRFFLQDSWYDIYRGTVNLVQIIDGVLNLNDVIKSTTTDQVYTIKTLGLLSPEELPIKSLHCGQIGVMTCNMKTPKDAIIGDTFHRKDEPVEPLMNVSRPKPMVFAGIYPIDQTDPSKMKTSLDKVCLNDYSVTISSESSLALGTGWRLGFLGVLHMEVFTQRLEDEYNASVIVTPPSVPYKIKIKDYVAKSNRYSKTIETGNLITVNNPQEFPLASDIEEYMEPIVHGTIIAPSEYLSDITKLASEFRGIEIQRDFIDQTRLRFVYVFPLSEIVVRFFDTLKSITSGYASFDYEDAGYKVANLSKVDILVNEKPIPELATITHTTRAREHSKRLVRRLEENITRQQFAIKIQACAKGKVLARGDIEPYKKDVTSKLYGGDLTRKAKKLRHQAEGKKRLKMYGKVQISQDVFRKLLS